MAKKVLIRFYAENNLGDDLFIKVLARRYIDDFSYFNQSGVVPLSGDNVRIISRPSYFFKVWQIIDRVLRRRYSWLVHEANRQDFFLYVGGSLFMETQGYKPWLREKIFYDKLKRPYYILGSNFGPVQTDDFISIMNSVFGKARDVCFRDQASYNLFKDVSNTRVATDIAFTLDTSDFNSIAPEKRIVFSVIDACKKFDEEAVAKYEQEITNLVKKSLEDGYKVTLMSFCKFEGDESAIERIMGRMDDELRKKIETYMYRGDLDEALTVLAKSEVVVASRFHASILGLLFGKKVLPMAYSDKTTNILNDMNFEGPVIDIRKIDEFDGSTFDFSSLEINDVSAQKTLAEKQFQELDKVLTRRK